MSDRSKDTSTALTEVRTVHSRAISALDRIEGVWGGDNFYDPEYPSWEECRDDFDMTYAEWHHWRPGFMMADPDHDDMIAALEQVTELLAPWSKGRRKR